MQQPTFFIPHGGGPCFFMDDPRGVWTGMEAFLRNLVPGLPERPRAVLIVSGHWETDGFALTGAPQPSLIYDFPAPAARLSHPRAEHLLPLMVAAGASDAAGEHIYAQTVLDTAISGFRFN